LAPRPEIAAGPCDFNQNGRVARNETPFGRLSGVDDSEGAPYKARKWRRAEILPPMFFQEQFEN
jgi:hypothetical protein